MTRRLVLALFIVMAAFGCRQAPAPADRAILILISIDGWRWDYLQRFSPPTLSRLAAEGVRAEGLIPQFPSKTFPNHYTIVTGLTLAHHGIVSNNMRDQDIPGEFGMSKREVIADPRWWGGDPIWNTAERQGKVASAMFWPGSETVIGGRQATYWAPFNDDFPNDARVAEALDWLTLPDDRRPSFLTLYFSDVDTAGHRFGPDAEQTREAVLSVDRTIGGLIAGVASAGLADRVNYLVVSDHGMSGLSPDRQIMVDDYIDPATADIVDWSPVLGLSPKDGDVEKMYAALKDKHPHLHVYRRDEIPAVYGLAGHPRVSPIVGIADEGWNVTSRAEAERWRQPDRRAPGGTHGYDARIKDMQGLFIATGPRLRRGLVVTPFENIHVYNLMCAVIGVEPSPNDGDPAVIQDMLR
ncbi:MAG: ectonucleotide pyrophosphatase/phosphodiesterase [Vicinamibacterales bacterium]